MAVLLDRKSEDTEFQENLKKLKQHYAIYHAKKGAGEAIYKLLDWYVNEYPTEKKIAQDRVNQNSHYKEKYKEVQMCLQILDDHKKLMEHAASS